MNFSILVFVSIVALASVHSANNTITNSTFDSNSTFTRTEDVVLSGLGTISGSVENHTSPDERFSRFDGFTFVALNIPYAKPPVHERRFAPPHTIGTWNKTINGNRHTSGGLRQRSCHQEKGSSGMIEQNPDSRILEFWMELGGLPAVLPLGWTEQSEDCLYLNVYVPLDKNTSFLTGLSVMVFLHGGGFREGSAFQPLYEGVPISRVGQVIIVTVNYRLSSLGFLYNGKKDAVGNMGLMDQAMAIKWVHDNIQNFGGDPESITIFGESAGSAAVNYQMLAPMSRPNFKRAIMQSGNAFNHWAFTEPEQAEEHGNRLGNAMGCANPTFLIDCLRRKNATDILKTGEMLQIMFTPTKDRASLTFVGQDFIPKHPEELLMDFLVDLDKAPEVMLGVNENEGALFLPIMLPNDYPAGSYMENNPVSETLFRKTMRVMNHFALRSEYVMEKIEERYLFKNNPDKNLQSVIKFISQDMITCNATFLARKLGSLGKVAMYKFNIPLSFFEKDYPWMGAAHALELPLVFGRPFLNTPLYTDNERISSYHVAMLWTQFAKHGITDSIPASYGENSIPDSIPASYGENSIPASYGEKFFLIDEHFAFTEQGKFHAKMMDSFDDQCHFIDCLPSLELFGNEERMEDQTCTKYTVSGSEKTRISMVLSWVLAFGLLFFLH